MKLSNDKMKPLTRAEMDVMNVLWDAQRALTVSEIVEGYAEPRPAYTTVATFLKILEAKGYVEHKRKEEHIWHMSQLREQATADKYKKLTIRYQVEFTIVLFYGIIVTALQVIATPKLMEGAIKFIAYWFQALVDFDTNVIGFGHKVANISSLIPDPTASGIVFWVLLILISVIVIGIVYLTIFSLIITYVRYLKANQFDRYTVIAAITVLAFTIFLANVIKGIAPVNLCAIQIGLFLIYSGTRAWVERRRIGVR